MIEKSRLELAGRLGGEPAGARLLIRKSALPIIQCTVRDLPSGLLFCAFAEKRSAAASAIFATRDVARKRISAKMGT